MNTEQLKAIVWLRWRLSRNQFSRGGTLNAVISVLIMVVMAIAGVGLTIGGFLGGWFGMTKGPPSSTLWVWDGLLAGFMFIWLTGLMVEIQRSESIDLT